MNATKKVTTFISLNVMIALCLYTKYTTPDHYTATIMINMFIVLNFLGAFLISVPWVLMNRHLNTRSRMLALKAKKAHSTKTPIKVIDMLLDIIFGTFSLVMLKMPVIPVAIIAVRVSAFIRDTLISNIIFKTNPNLITDVFNGITKLENENEYKH